jgi:serine/threonine-protein kinase
MSVHDALAATQATSAFDRTVADEGLGATIAAPLPSLTGTAPTPAPSHHTTVLPKVEVLAGSVALVPSSMPRYQRVRVLGQGGMGEVALVEDRDIGRTVALKRLLRDAAPAAAVARFVDEVRIVGKLEHPNIVPIHDVGVDEHGEYFFVMKYVDGETLDDVLERLRAGDLATRREWDFTRRIEVFIAILRALQHAHERGYIHRDVKPANVMIGKHGEVLLMDWGIARPVGGQREAALVSGHASSGPFSGSVSSAGRASATNAGSLIGTPLYMSPEQAACETDTLDPRSDLYSATVLFHELLGLRHRHEGIQGLEPLIAAIIVTEAPTPYRLFDPHPAQPSAVPPELLHFVRRGLQRRREDRWQSAEEMIAELHAILDGRCRVQCAFTLSKRMTREMGRFIDRRPQLAVTLGFFGFVAFLALVALAIRGLLA